MAETPEYTRGPAEVGTTQLPMGEATQLNDQVKANDATAAQNQATEPSVPLQPIKTAKPETGPVVTGQDEDALFGPTHLPQEPVTAGAGVGRFTSHPSGLSGVIDALSGAAAVPDAPPAVRNLLQLLMYHVGSNAS